MFRNIDKFKLELMMERDPELRKIITQLLENHRLSMSTISHELRNPLTLVSSAIQLIQSQHPEVHDFNYWEQMLEDVQFIIDLVGEIGSYSNCNYLKMEDFSMRELLRNMAVMFAISLEGTGIEFTSYIEPNINKFYGDRVKLQEVIFNLLKNAQQAIESQEKSERRKKPGLIELRANKNRGGVTIRVRDNGCGIDAHSIKSIFEPFVTHKQDGTGLGLSIAKQIAEAHHGTLEVRSIYGKGATFILTL